MKKLRKNHTIIAYKLELDDNGIYKIVNDRKEYIYVFEGRV